MQPNHPAANHNLGILRLASSEDESCLVFFKKAIESDAPTDHFWLSYIGALIKLEKLEDARCALEEAREKGVDSSKLEAVGESLSLKSTAKGSLTSSPTKERLGNLLNLFESGDYATAESVALGLTASSPLHPLPWKVLGASLTPTERGQEAIAVFQKSWVGYLMMLSCITTWQKFTRKCDHLIRLVKIMSEH